VAKCEAGINEEDNKQLYVKGQTWDNSETGLKIDNENEEGIFTIPENYILKNQDLTLIN